MSKFELAAEEVKNLSTKPSNDTLLELYGLYKQGTVGKVNTDRPGLFDPKGKAKWDAWKARENLTKEEAQEKYVTLVESLLGRTL